MGSVTVVSDFDGTISLGDFPALVLDNYCKVDWRDLDKAFRRGEMTLQELIETEVANLDITRKGLAEFAKEKMKFRPGFWEFHKAVLERGFNLIILSEGLKEYIEPFFGDEVEIYANECTQNLKTGQLHLRTPYASDECEECGNCKVNILKHFSDQGDFVIYIGDGESDFCAAEHADMRFARDKLAKHLEQQHLEFVLYDDFFDILEIIERTGK